MLKVGEQAPLFQAESTEGTIQLQHYLGKQPIVLIFYPKDETPICTKQLCAVRDSKSLYERYNALVLGVNPGSLAHHKEFAAKQGYDFPLVSDENEAIRKAYDVSKILGFYAQQRIVYVIDAQGRIAFAAKGNRSTEEILGALQAMK